MKWICFFLLSFVFSCTHMKENYRERVCNYDGAYEEGTNDAQNGEEMRGSYVANQCHDKVKADVRKGYRDGYTNSKASRPHNMVVTRKNKNGRGSGPRSAYTRMCIDSFGKKVCGYGCIESYGKAKCARHPGNHCMDEFGKIVCGHNCYEQAGKILCEYRE